MQQITGEEIYDKIVEKMRNEGITTYDLQIKRKDIGISYFTLLWIKKGRLGPKTIAFIKDYLGLDIQKHQLITT